jgi:hypothetical protein
MGAGRERNHARVLFEHGIDLSDRLERQHRERQAEAERTRAELERARRPWWRRWWFGR